MIASETLHAASGVLLALTAVGFVLGARRLPAACRRYGYAPALACGAMAATYVLMSAGALTVSTTGGDESVVRFVGYTIAWAAISYVVGAVADAGRRHTLLLFGCSTVSIWGTFASWLLDGIAGTVVSAGILLGVIGLAAVLFGPVGRTATTVSDARSLLYHKLRNLLLLAWAGLILVGILSEQNLSLTDGFVGQVAATYIDLVLLVGFGGLVLRSADALADAGATTLRSVSSTE